MSAVRPPFSVHLPSGRVLDLGTRPLVMGILNVTPDSFSDGGQSFDAAAAVAAAERMVEEGADVLDIGGESTRPGAEPVPAAEEWRRVGPVIETLARRVGVPLSIDTYKAEIATRALDRGVDLVNDVSGLQRDPAMADVVRTFRAAVVLMHARGTSRDMYAEATYTDVVEQVVDELGAAVDRATEAGVDRAQIIVDPGLGFAKRAEHTLAIIREFGRLHRLGRPVMVGPSRKSFLAPFSRRDTPTARLFGTAAAVTAAVLAGAHIVRVHDVAEMVTVVRAADGMCTR